MTTKKGNYAFLWIALVCVIIITSISIFNFMKPVITEKNTLDNVKGYLMTNDGIYHVANEDGKISKSSIIANDKISSFNLTKESIVFQEKVEEASKNVNIYNYNLKTKETTNILSSGEEKSYTKAATIGDDLVGALQDDNVNLNRQLTLVNIKTKDIVNITSPTTTEDNSVIDWAVSPSGNTLVFKDSTDSIYLYNVKKKETTLIGTFNNVFGYLDDGTVWLSNVEDDKKLILYNVVTKQQQPVSLTDELSKVTFLNGKLLPNTKQETSVWSTSGFYGTDYASQKILSISADKTDTIFDLTAAGFKFLNSQLEFDPNYSVVIVSAVDNLDTQGILFISILSGDIVASIPGEEFILTE